jgi:serine/threonine protein kinase
MEKYSYVKLLGTGSSSTVSLYIHTSSRKYFAIKTLKKRKSSKIITRELKSLQSLKGSQNIINLTESIEETENFHIVLEYCKDGNLTDYLENNRKIPFSHKISLIVDIIRAVYDLHSLKIIHRDLKTSNFLLNEGIVKLADFGISRKPDKSDLTLCGTPFYMAPEMFSGVRYNSKVDIWAIGVIFYEILLGRHPFTANTLDELIRNINMKVDFQGLGEDEVEILKMALQVKPGLRSGIKKMTECALVKNYLGKIFKGLEMLLEYFESHQIYFAFFYAKFVVLCYLIKDVLYCKCKSLFKEELKKTAEKIKINKVDENSWRIIIEQAELALELIAKVSVLRANYLMYVLKRLKNTSFFDCFNQYLD